MKVDWNPNIVTRLHPLDRIETNLRRVMLHTDDAVGAIKMAESLPGRTSRLEKRLGKERCWPIASTWRRSLLPKI